MDASIWNDVDPTAQDAQSLSLPSVFWLNGNSELEEVGGVAYTGGLFLTYEAIGREDIEIPNWKASSFKGSEGKKVLGVATNQGYISIVRTRKRWFREGDNGIEFRPWRSEYVTGFRGQLQGVGFIRGLDDPVCFTFKGNAMKNLLSILSEHNRKLVAAVNRKAPKGAPGLPPYAVWMPIRAGKHEKVGQGRQQSEVTLPLIGLPQQVTDDYAMKCVVTREQLAQFQSLYKEAAAWAQEWEGGGAEEMSKRELADSAQAPRHQDAGEPEWPEPATGEPDDDGIPF